MSRLIKGKVTPEIKNLWKIEGDILVLGQEMSDSEIGAVIRHLMGRMSFGIVPDLKDMNHKASMLYKCLFDDFNALYHLLGVEFQETGDPFNNAE
jgi:hypothetical protein